MKWLKYFLCEVLSLGHSSLKSSVLFNSYVTAGNRALENTHSLEAKPEINSMCFRSFTHWVLFKFIWNVRMNATFWAYCEKVAFFVLRGSTTGIYLKNKCWTAASVQNKKLWATNYCNLLCLKKIQIHFWKVFSICRF